MAETAINWHLLRMVSMYPEVAVKEGCTLKNITIAAVDPHMVVAVSIFRNLTFT